MSERLQTIEAKAWAAYQAARAKAATNRNAQTLLAVIEAGERWERRNEDLHNYGAAYERRKARVAAKGRL